MSHDRRLYGDGTNDDYAAIQSLLDSVYRSERVYPTPTIKIDEGATVKGLKISDVVTENLTGKPMNEIVVDGEVGFVD